MAASITMASECEGEKLYQQLHLIRPEFTKDDYLGENGWDLDAMKADLALMTRQDKEDGEKLFMQLSSMDPMFERCDYLQNGEWDITALHVDIQAVKQEQGTRFPQEPTVTQFDQDEIAARTVRMQGDTTGVIVDTFGQKGFVVDTNEGTVCVEDGIMVDASASHIVNTDMGLGEIVDTCGDNGFVVDLGANLHVADPTGDMVNLLSPRPEDSTVVRSGPIPVPVLPETNSAEVAEAVVDEVVDNGAVCYGEMIEDVIPSMDCLPDEFQQLESTVECNLPAATDPEVLAESDVIEIEDDSEVLMEDDVMMMGGETDIPASDRVAEEPHAEIVEQSDTAEVEPTPMEDEVMMPPVPEVECLPEPIWDDVMAVPAMQMISRGISEPVLMTDEQSPMTEEITTEPVIEPALPTTELMTEPMPMTEEIPTTKPATKEEELPEVCQDTMPVSSDVRIDEKIDPAIVAEVPVWAVPRRRRPSRICKEAQKARSKRRVSKKKKSSKKTQKPKKPAKKSLKKRASKKA